MAVPANFPIFANLPTGLNPLSLFDTAFGMILNGSAPVPIASIAIGTTTVSGGASGRVLYDNAGVVGELAVTGTGNAVLANGPTITLANATGLPIATGVSGLGAGVATFLATPTSANLAAALTDETGSGAAVFANSPALAGVPTAPTAVLGTNTTQVATTAFVTAATPAATTAVNGLVKLATLAQTLAQSPAGLVPTIENLYFPTGHLYGLTLSNTSGSAANKIDIAAGTARDDTDSYNYVLTSALTAKDVTSAWGVGSSAGMLDTGAIGNNKYYIWGIGRSDTRVNDALCSLSNTSPTMPTNYNYKVILGEFTRAAATNGPPLWYGRRKVPSGYDGLNFSAPVASTSGTSIDFTGIPSWATNVIIFFAGVSYNANAVPMVQIGAGSVSSSGYVGSAGDYLPTATFGNSTSGFVLSGSTGGLAVAAAVVHGRIELTLENPTNGTWVCASNLAATGTNNTATGAGYKTLSGVLDRVRITSAAGTATFDAGEINVAWR